MGCCKDNPAPATAWTGEQRAAFLAVCKACEIRVTVRGVWFCGKPFILNPTAVADAGRRTVRRVLDGIGIELAVPRTKREARPCGCACRAMIRLGKPCPLGRWP